MMKKKLIADIKKRGISYESTSATGKKYDKDNPSVKILPTYINAMVSVLQKLGLQDPEQEEDDRL